MNESAFTRKEEYKYILGLSALTAVLALTRTFPLYLFATVPAAVATLLIVRRRLLKKLTKSRIMQVAFAALIEPIQEYRYHNAGRDENGHPIEKRRLETVGCRRRDIQLLRHIDACYVDLYKYVSLKANPLVMICGRSGMGKSELMKMLLLNLKGPKII